MSPELRYLLEVNRLQTFLVVDGVIVAAGLVLFLFLYSRRGQDNAFKDDLWKEKKRKEAEQKKAVLEDMVDKKILLEHRPDPKEQNEQEEKATPEQSQRKAEFRVPNFRGKPHEVLGVPADAKRDFILRAYKHWIKRYHPDRVTHLGGKYVEQARRRAEQLNNARDELLKTAKI